MSHRLKRLVGSLGPLAFVLVAFAGSPHWLPGGTAEAETELWCQYYYWCGGCDPTPCGDADCPHVCDNGCTSGVLNLCADE